MKRSILMMMIAMCVAVNVSAQKNNPYAEFGKNYFTGVSNVVSDFNKNGFKGNDQESLDYYLKISGVEANANPELAATLYKTFYDPKFNASQFLMSDKTISENAKKLLQGILKNMEEMKPDEMEKYFEEVVDNIKTTDVKDAEKELLLHLASIADYAWLNSVSLRSKAKCEGTDELGQTVALPNAVCNTAMAAVGFFTGLGACGPLCGVGGAIIFGVISAVSLS